LPGQFSVAINNSHTDRRMTQGIQRVFLLRVGVNFQSRLIEYCVELTLDHFGCSCSVRVLWQEQRRIVVVIGVSLADPF
jgi:hypothetical protein